MNREIISSLKVAGIYAATVMGAGFASGRELIQFFVFYKTWGFFGIILSGVLFSAIGYIVLDRVYTFRINDFDEFIMPVAGAFSGRIIRTSMTLFIASLFCIMLSGASGIVSNTLNLPFLYGSLIMAVLVMSVLFFNFRGLVFIGNIITPVLIAGIFFTALYIIICRSVAVFNSTQYFNILSKNWISSSILYVSYNSFLSVTVLCGLLPWLSSKRVALAGGILGGGVLCVIALLVAAALYIFYPVSLEGSFPVLDITAKYNYLMNKYYTFILWLAMFFSALTSGNCITKQISAKTRINSRTVVVILCALSMPVSGIGFSGLIASVYPAFGYVGLFMLSIIFITAIKGKKHS